MSFLQKRSTATPDTIRRELLTAIQSALQTIECGQRALEKLHKIRHLLESLPQATGEYSLSCNRLGNVRHYLESEEHGAARYELRLLAGMLRNN